MLLNVVKLVQAIKEVSEQIRAVKAPLRSRWVGGMAAEQWELLRLKKRATSLCALRAAVRGRRHLPGLDEAAHEAFIAPVRAEFEEATLPAPGSSTAGASSAPLVG